MKRVFIYILMLLLCTPLPLQAVLWGVLEDVVENEIQFPYVIDRVLNNEFIRYAVSPEITPQEEQIFIDSVRKWPRETLQEIKNLRRTFEFRDIIPLLEREIKFQKTDKAHADITISVENGYCGSNAAGCFSQYDKKIVIVPKYRNFAPIMLHEVGHYWGLGDQYASARYNSDSEYSSDVNTKEGALMQGSYTTNGNLTCDDFDGLINLFDLRLSQRKGTFSPRAKMGWWGLCPETHNHYKEARTINRKQFDYLAAYDGTKIGIEYQDGKMINGFPAPSTSTKEDVLSLFALPSDAKIHYDENGRIERISSHERTATCPLRKDGKSSRYVQYKEDSMSIGCVGGDDYTEIGPLSKNPLEIPLNPKQFQVPGTEFAKITKASFYFLLEKNKIRRISINIWAKDPKCGSGRAALVYDMESKTYTKTGVYGCQRLGYVLSKSATDKKPIIPQSVLPTHRKVLERLGSELVRQAALLENWYRYFYRPYKGLDKKKQEEAKKGVKDALSAVFKGKNSTPQKAAPGKNTSAKPAAKSTTKSQGQKTSAKATPATKSSAGTKNAGTKTSGQKSGTKSGTKQGTKKNTKTTKNPARKSGVFANCLATNIQRLTFGELEAFAGTGLTGFLSFHHTRIARKVARFFNGLFDVFANGRQRAGNRVT